MSFIFINLHIFFFFELDFIRFAGKKLFETEIKFKERRQLKFLTALIKSGAADWLF